MLYAYERLPVARDWYCSKPPGGSKQKDQRTFVCVVSNRTVIEPSCWWEYQVHVIKEKKNLRFSGTRTLSEDENRLGYWSFLIPVRWQRYCDREKKGPYMTNRTLNYSHSLLFPFNPYSYSSQSKQAIKQNNQNPSIRKNKRLVPCRVSQAIAS